MGLKLLTQDVDTIIYKILHGSDLLSTITGQIYKDAFRPTNSGKEDVSIKTLAISQEQPQIAICNVNCHIPDIKQTLNGRIEYVPNSAKLRSVAYKVQEIINQALVSPAYENFSLRMDDQKTFKNQDTEVREHFQNIRIELIIPNI